MAYRDDINHFSEEMANRRKTMFFIVKITVVILALVLICMTVLLVVNMVSENKAPSSLGSEGGSSGSSSASRKLTFSDKVDANQEVFLKIGSTVSYFDYIRIPTGYTKENISVDNSAVDTGKAGSYRVVYTLTNASGKKVGSLELKIVIGNCSKDELMTMVAQKATELGITESMSTVEKVRKIFDYVNSPNAGRDNANFIFKDNHPHSSRPNWETANWESDWVDEAYIGLTYKEADCFTYFALSKAFFEYFKIENLGIKRGYDSTFGGAHVLNLVNIGTADRPQWYFYDATRLGGKFTACQNACLVTKTQLDSYTSSKGQGGFYNFSTTGLVDSKGKTVVPATEALS